jgi:hypothetical protein
LSGFVRFSALVDAPMSEFGRFPEKSDDSAVRICPLPREGLAARDSF